MSVKITALEAENVKRIKAVALTPSPTGLTLVGGNNNQGKTSVLDALAWALGGDRFRPDAAQRDGAVAPAHLKVKLSNGVVVERKGKNSTLTVTNCTDRGNWEGRSGFNGADVKIVNGSTANISGNHGGYGIHANNLLVENSTLTANDNGYGSIRITGKGEFINSTVTVTDTEDKGNASVEITWGVNETGGLLNGSLSVRNSTLNISDNNATGIACLAIGGSHRSLTIDDASRVTIQNNNATPRNGFNAKGAVGGGLRIEAGCSAVLGRNTRDKLSRTFSSNSQKIHKKRCQKHRMASDTSFDRLHFSVQQVFAEIHIVWQLVDIWLPAPLDFRQFQRIGCFQRVIVARHI